MHTVISRSNRNTCTLTSSQCEHVKTEKKRLFNHTKSPGVPIQRYIQILHRTQTKMAWFMRRGYAIIMVFAVLPMIALLVEVATPWMVDVGNGGCIGMFFNCTKCKSTVLFIFSTCI